MKKTKSSQLSPMLNEWIRKLKMTQNWTYLQWITISLFYYIDLGKDFYLFGIFATLVVNLGLNYQDLEFHLTLISGFSLLVPEIIRSIMIMKNLKEMKQLRMVFKSHQIDKFYNVLTCIVAPHVLHWKHCSLETQILKECHKIQGILSDQETVDQALLVIDEKLQYLKQLYLQRKQVLVALADSKQFEISYETLIQYLLQIYLYTVLVSKDIFIWFKYFGAEENHRTFIFTDIQHKEITDKGRFG